MWDYWFLRLEIKAAYFVGQSQELHNIFTGQDSDMGISLKTPSEILEIKMGMHGDDFHFSQVNFVKA